MPQSAGRLWPPRVLRQPPVNAFEKIAELRRRHRYCPIRRRWPDEATALQPLREQAHALAIVPQHLDQAAAPAAEHEQVAIVGITLERLLYQQRQAVEALAHVGVAGRQPHPHAARDRDHRPNPSSASASATARAGATPSGKRITRPLRSTTSITGPKPALPAVTATASFPGAIATGTKRVPSSAATDRTPVRACRRHKWSRLG